MSEEQERTPQEEKKDLIAGAKGLPPPEIFSLKPRTFDEAFRFANLIAESTLIPKEFQKNPANVLIAVQLGMELGVSPMQALQSIAVVNGRPTIWGDLLPAIVYGSQLMEVFDEQGDDTQASCTVKRRGFAPITRTFTMQEAKKAMAYEWVNGQRQTISLADKQTYKSYPRRMLQMRARAFALRDAFPDVLKGVAIHEEAEDITPRDVTPIRTPQALTEKKDDEKPKPATSSGSEKPATDSSASGPVGSEASGTRTTRRRTTAGDAPTVEQKQVAQDPPKEQAASAIHQETQGTPPIEKTQEDWINEGKLWIENAPADELLADDNWLFQNIKQLKGTVNQMELLKPFNARRQALAAGK